MIHWLVPSAAAARPSRLDAHLAVTKGRPSRVAVSHGVHGLCDLVGEHAADDVDARLAQALGAAAGARAGIADARRRRVLTPAAISASLHGPVRPVWLQGSRVTTAVAPRASPGASLRERVDLGVRGAGAAVPALGEDVAGGERITQPTCGLTP